MHHTPFVMSQKRHNWQEISGKYIPFDQYYAWRCTECGMMIVEDIYGDLHDVTVGNVYTIGIMPCVGKPDLKLDDEAVV